MSVFAKTLIGIAFLGAGGAAVLTGGICCHSSALAAPAADEKTTTLEVKGMTCASCSVAVKTALKRVEGYKSAEVSVKDGRVVVTYDPAKTDPAKLAAAVTKLGYESKPADEANASSDPD